MEIIVILPFLAFFWMILMFYSLCNGGDYLDQNPHFEILEQHTKTSHKSDSSQTISPTVEILQLEPGDKILCNVCGAVITEDDKVYCDKCNTPHHRKCWTYNGKCTTYACGCESYHTEIPTNPYWGEEPD